MDYAFAMAKESNSTVRQAQVFIVDLVLTIGGIGLIALGARAVWLENLGLAGTALGSGLVLLLASTIHRFESLKGLGIEAKTRELDKALDKAEVTLAQVKALAELTGANLVLLYSSIGRWGAAPSNIEAYEQSRRVKEMLKTIGSDDRAIRAALEPWAKTAAQDLLRFRHQKIHEQIILAQQQLSQEVMNAQPPRKADLERRLHTLSNYGFKDIAGVASWEISSYGARLREHLQQVPEPLDAAVSAGLYADIS